jgi:hypothetical protein
LPVARPVFSFTWPLARSTLSPKIVSFRITLLSGCPTQRRLRKTKDYPRSARATSTGSRGPRVTNPFDYLQRTLAPWGDGREAVCLNWRSRRRRS